MNDGFLPGLGRFFGIPSPHTADAVAAGQTDRPTEAPSDCERGRRSEKDSQTDDGNEKHGGFEASFHLVKRSHEEELRYC